jgi:hypothetical protein
MLLGLTSSSSRRLPTQIREPGGHLRNPALGAMD